jgi:translin
MRRLLSDLEAIAEAANQELAAKSAAREVGLRASREAVRNSANAIRALHRDELVKAEALASRAAVLLAEAREAMAAHQDIYHAGFLHDAEKEYAEARLAIAVIAGGESLPSPADLGVGVAAYLNGLGEAVGELRRYVLDSLRRGDMSRSEALLEVMDEVYSALVTFDYPDAMTGGLRRTTDNVRGILERTRGDLTLAVRQKHLEASLQEFERRLG